ncbi:hypothetical protein VTN00DRAFT_9500 [Thermoascus crustaceus]|uniref:uncharacterized protein n=1 Tax=Thermoascus crustaceus TaxID=5088 RepID=UPI003742B8CE
MEPGSSNMITEIEGDLFDAPDGAVLIHACNCKGSWGAGIARAFRDKYPAACEVYRSHCRSFLESAKYATASPSESDSCDQTIKSRILRLPEGTALIIPPQERDYLPGLAQRPRRPRRGYARSRATDTKQSERKKKHWIVCLFTSRGFGRTVCPPDVILENTALAVEDMKRQLEELQDGAEDNGSADKPGELWSCRFNSGLFAVDWKDSRKILEDSGLKVTVVRPPGE